MKYIMETNNLVDTSISISKEVIILIAKMAFVEVMKIINFFLEQIRDYIVVFAPTDLDINTSTNKGNDLLRVIETISQSKEFQDKWEQFSQNIASLLKILVEKVSEATSNDVDIIMQKLTELLEKNITNAVSGAGAAALRGVCALPPAVPFCMMANIASTSTKLGGETLITMLMTASKLADALSKIIGDTALPFVETIQKAKDFITYIQDMQKQLSSNIDNIQNIATNKINEAQNNALDKLQQPLQQVQP